MTRLFILAILALIASVPSTGQSAETTNNLPDDATIQQRIVGTWWYFPEPYHYFEDTLLYTKSKLTIASSGDYLCEITFKHGAVIQTNELEGKYRVKDGMLISTITKLSITNQPVPMVFTNQVVRVNDRELVYRDSRDDRLVVFRKAKR
jgi:hypothetical protein